MNELFENQEELENFVKLMNFSNINLEMKTMGGTVCWGTIVDLFGWKVQQHSVLGMNSHYRILDNNNIRRAWILNPQDLVDALDNYRAGKRMKL